MFHVYALYNKERDKIYIGQTSELNIRLQRHNGLLPQKKTAFTSRNDGVWELFYQEDYETRAEAMKREKQLKTSAGRRFIRSKIKK